MVLIDTVILRAAFESARRGVISAILDTILLSLFLILLSFMIRYHKLGTS